MERVLHRLRTRFESWPPSNFLGNRMNCKRYQHPKRLPLMLAVLSCLYGTAAFAQAQKPDQEPAAQGAPQTKSKAGQPEQDPKALDTVTVTGSLLRRAEYDTISPVQVITADTSVAVGQVDTAEFLQQSSVAAGSTQFSNQFSGFVTEGGIGTQTVSLRGLGANRTLVLLNGNRPGPAGTRGQVGAFDLNVIPQVILQRAEIVKDGSSSIYGSDAVAGVVNLITRRNIKSPEFSFSTRVPFAGGGEVFEVSGATGWNFDRASITLAGSYFVQEALKQGDRDFLKCSNDIFYDAQGNRIDRQDRSILAGTSLAGCNNMLINAVDDALRGTRYVPSPDGTTIGLIPGYRPRRNTTYANSPQASYEEVLNAQFLSQGDIYSRQERYSVYSSIDMSLGDNLNWTAEALFNERTTQARRFRQFFPIVGGATATNPAYRYANNPTYVAPVPSGVARPILPFRSDQDVKIDYFYVNSGLDGALPFGNWTWKTNASYSRSKGSYNQLGIRASTSGDVTLSDDAPRVNYFDPGFLSGARMDELVSAIGVWHKGTTVYDQFVTSGVVTGDLFQLPAGAVAAAVGMEYRNFGINDQPSELSQTGDLWGQTSAQVTKGRDNVKEAFTEVEVPLVKGVTGVEALTFNMSARVFDYASVKNTDNVWKLGLSWQIVPSLRLRATKGTSYRAPGLYELYLGNQSGFVSQTSIDPCIRWGESTNSLIRTNCAAAGVPADYAGAASSATVFTGGGAGFLKPETSEAFTAGMVFTPSSIPLSLAFDYFSYQVNNQISELDAASILGGCYGSPVYPNAFCGMFVRNPNTSPTDPNKIDNVRATYVNINKQKVRGYDLLAHYEETLAFGKLESEAQVTYTMEDVEQLFSTAAASGFESNNLNGYIGRPRVVGNLRTSLDRGDWSYTWGVDYVGPTKNFYIQPTTTYQGRPDSVRKITAESRLYHSLSVQYDGGDWSVLLGVRNIFDTTPPVMSSGAATRYGNVPAFATQYDWYGRTLFARFNYKF